jgi:hypothetical protein
LRFVADCSMLVGMGETGHGAAPDGPASRSLGVVSKGRLAWLDVAELPLTPGRFRVKTLYSGLSAGTELTYLKGSNPALHSSWDREWGIFQAERPATAYPVQQLGYMEVGRVGRQPDGRRSMRGGWWR